MKCEACQSVLEDYFDGELAARRAAEVRAHVAGCAACAASLAELQQEHQIYAAYERGVEVTPDLWAGIAARIKTEKAAMPDASSTSRWRGWLAGVFAAPHISPAFAATMVVLAIGLTIAVMNYLHSRNANNNGNTTVATTGDSNNSNKNGAVSPVPNQGDEGSKPGLATNTDNQNKPNVGNQPVKEVKTAPQRQLQAVTRKQKAPP